MYLNVLPAETPTSVVSYSALAIGLPIGLFTLFLLAGVSAGFLLLLMNYCQRKTSNRHSDTGEKSALNGQVEQLACPVHYDELVFQGSSVQNSCIMP